MFYRSLFLVYITKGLFPRYLMYKKRGDSSFYAFLFFLLACMCVCVRACASIPFFLKLFCMSLIHTYKPPHPTEHRPTNVAGPAVEDAVKKLPLGVRCVEKLFRANAPTHIVGGRRVRTPYILYGKTVASAPRPPRDRTGGRSPASC